MLTQNELLKYPNYLLSKYQLEIFRQVKDYMDTNKLSQKDMAEKLSVSPSYLNQILNGNFNFTLKKVIELSLAINKVPSLKFVNADEFFSNNTKNIVAMPFVSTSKNSLNLLIFSLIFFIV